MRIIHWNPSPKDLCHPSSRKFQVEAASGAGLGKTTLAHVVARHCGYRPVEINASDDRSATALVQRVLDSAQMRTVTGDARPACIIIDEIDGAVGSPVWQTAVHGLPCRAGMRA